MTVDIAPASAHLCDDLEVVVEPLPQSDDREPAFVPA